MDKYIGKLYCIKCHSVASKTGFKADLTKDKIYDLFEREGYANLLFKDDRMIICVYNYYTSYVVPLDKVRSDKIDLIIK